MLVLYFLTICLVEVACWWRPHQHMSWNDVIGEDNINTGIHGDVYVIDLFSSHHQRLIPTLHSKGKKVVCYFSAGTYENWRPDRHSFPSDALGSALIHWDNEWWVDIRDSRIRTVMARRIAMAKQHGCDGVDPDNVDGYSNQNGLGLTSSDQLDFNRYLAREAHNHGLAIGLKNDLKQISSLVHDFDFAINESCEKYHECHYYQPFFDARKPVFHIEYVDSTSQAHSHRSSICSNRPSDMNTIIKVHLDNFKVGC
ncbi:uncharacterized protein LOC125682087 [Ostrea edulis]|uniref:uncharacterized protein LOC125682087 n=1 Tax=Ostrea edulis TaxID=37623 RepID=UPI0024AEF23A|nr:uncharacterized protein LOC125682087 [Ostrea edulis]